MIKKANYNDLLFITQQTFQFKSETYIPGALLCAKPYNSILLVPFYIEVPTRSAYHIFKVAQLKSPCKSTIRQMLTEFCLIISASIQPLEGKNWSSHHIGVDTIIPTKIGEGLDVPGAISGPNISRKYQFVKIQFISYFKG